MKGPLIFLLIVLGIGALALIWFLVAPDAPKPADTGTKRALSSEFAQELPDFPELNLSATFVLGDYALADWSDENIGGMVVFKRSGTTWGILVMDGGVLELRTLTDAGVPADVARELLSTDRY